MAEQFEELQEKIAANPSNLEDHLPRVLEEIKKDASGEFIKTCKYELRDDLMGAVKAAKNKHEKIMVEICIECMKRRTQSYFEQAKEIFNEKAIVKWKGHEDALDLITRDLEQPIEWEPTDDEKESDEAKHVSWGDSGSALKDTVSDIINACSRDKIIKKVQGSFVRLLSSCLQSGSDMHLVVALAIAESNEMTWEGTEKLIPDVLEIFFKWLRREDVDFEHNLDHKALAQAMPDCAMLENAGKSCVSQLKSILEYCLEQELEGDETPLSVHGDIISTIITDYILQDVDKVNKYKDLLPSVLKLLTCDVRDLEELAGNTLGALGENGDILVAYGDAIVEAYLSNKCEDTHICSALTGIYKNKPEVILSRMDKLAEKMEDMGHDDKTYMYLLLDEVAKQNPEALVSHIDLMMEDLCDPTLATLCFLALADISREYAIKFVEHIDKCVKAWELSAFSVSSACTIIASVGCTSEKEATRCLKILFDKVKTIDPMWISVILMEAKRIGMAYKECLAVYRPQLDKLKTCQQMGVPDLVQSLIDFLEDRSLQSLSKDVAEQQEDIDNLDSRVTNTENDITRIDETVTEQGDEILNVKKDVNEQGQRLDELEEVVDETVEKVEEIDHKTITNAPKWSRDVSKLLNPEHEHDWRFLAVRLGYSGEDIRNWALSPDPTMAILAEWYTTHKSSDATYAILGALEDMGRTDAAEIITQSLEEAEMLVPQAPSDDSGIPPTVFLSYQWDHQPEVKAIRKHLEMAGFPCWMDIGQMGGGDQLFAKINQGMRSSKVVLCMVTEKYSNSENCNKEVNLANLLNKPIIPVLIDHTKWPPEGAMSMLFAQLLYIQFYNDKEYVRGEKFWEDPKFSELLGQISYHANPEESMISEEYRNWIPQVEDKPATVKKVSEDTKNIPGVQQNQTTESVDPPTVFISYQWDKQPQIQRLFSRLTDLGYHCWLDINQMGGGDPLYSKIDKGVRNAKVVVSCVTSKYALSANCRREISLSDALRKPIIPLLLEEMTWPPEGPMSMTFTQLLYIDFTNETTVANFDDEKFEELVEKIKEHAEPTLGVEVLEDQDNMNNKPQRPAETETPELPGIGDGGKDTGQDNMTSPACDDGPQTTPDINKPRKEENNKPLDKTPSPSPEKKRNKKSSTCLVL
nr:uncharacterized protein LOC129262561 [Lytechinus pictus]